MAMGKSANNELSPGQLLIWLGMQRHPDAPVYNTVTTFHIAAELDHAIFEAAFHALVDESDALRSTFLDIDGVPQCIVRAPDREPLIDQVDLSADAPPDTKYQAWLAARSRRKLDVDTRAFDAALVMLGNGATIWFLNLHHLIADAWSTRLVYERVAQHYAALSDNQAISPEALPSFRSWVGNLKQDSENTRRTNVRRYWDDQADNAASLEPIACYGQTLESSDPMSDRQSIDLGAVRANAIRELLGDRSLRSLNDDVTLFQVFATVLFAFLYRASGNTALAIGAPSLNRSTATERRTIGLLMEMLLVQVEVAESDTLATLYTKVGTETLGFLRHGCAGTSSAKLVRTFAVLLNFVRGSYGEFCGIETAVDYIHTGAAEPHNALRVQVRDFTGLGNFSIDFDFNRETFSPRLRAVTVQQFLRMLDAFFDDRDARISDIDLLPADERKQLLVDLNQTAAPYPQSQPLHSLFERQADAAPNRVAVVDGSTQINYGELRRRSNRLAHELIARGVAKGQRVALLLDTGVDFVVAMIAVLKVGAAYIPIDTQAPETHHSQLLRSSDAALLITHKSLIRRQDPTTIQIDADWPAIAQRPATHPNVDVGIDDDAYVLFTSGSTGTPKGVRCRHRGVVNLLNDIDVRKPIRPGSSYSMWTNPGFDVSVFELFSALCFGGTLFVVPPLVRPDAARLYDWCCETGIQSGYLPPFVLDDFVDRSKHGNKQLALERLLVGVEPIAQQTLQTLAATNPRLTIINGYGPTETTICATLYTVPSAPVDQRRTPIGRPVRNNRVYLLDQFRQPVPYGLPGELYIGGDGVARGYIDNDAPADVRFIDDPFDPDSGVRLYRSGDRARYLADGSLEFIGRVDHQIKIRGYRIEPAEVEHKLVMHPKVREALVVARSLGEGSRILVAYLVSDGPLGLSAGDWHARLEPELPRHMIPSAYVELPAFPQTRSGKVDRSALPEPLLDNAAVASAAPETPLQSQIAAIWCEVLGRSSVGIHDHFIDIGGDSIQALQIVAGAHDRGIRFSAREVFEFPTVALLAEQATMIDPDHPPNAATGGSLADAASRAGISEQDLESLLSEFSEPDP